MTPALLLSFLAGIASVIVLEILKLESLLAPFRNFITALFPAA